MKNFELFAELFRTLVGYCLVGLAGLFFLMPAMVLIIILPTAQRQNSKLIAFLLYLFYWSCIRATFCPLKIMGKEHILSEPSIIASNHQSSLDIPVIGALFNRSPTLWFVLDYYAHRSWYGFFIRRMAIPINQKDAHEAARAVIKAIRFVIENPRNLIIFPEGARHIDEKVHDFFRGFAIIAKRTKMPVTPVYMPNNGKMYPPNSFFSTRVRYVWL